MKFAQLLANIEARNYSNLTKVKGTRYRIHTDLENHRNRNMEAPLKSKRRDDMTQNPSNPSFPVSLAHGNFLAPMTAHMEPLVMLLK